MKIPARILYLLLPVLVSGASLADERILNYHSDITVLENAEMQVTEHITVRAEGINIKRGIYRDFPTLYKDNYGNKYRVDFGIRQILRDGNPEPHHTENLSNGVRVYIGDQNTFLKHGEYTYSITYNTARQLGYFEQHDELYWNVTGNGWNFIIDKASANVKLPDTVPRSSITMEGYTGESGSKAQNYTARITDEGRAYFETTAPLAPYHGLTIVVGWPKGYVYEPAAGEKMGYTLRDNRHLLIGIIGLLILSGYYVMMWSKAGRDPEKGVIFPHYEPPKGYSPASMRFVEKMGYDNTCFAAALINLAVKGFLTITEDKKNSYTLTKTGKTGIEMSPGESALVKSLFASRDSIELKQTNHAKISMAIEAHKTSLKNNYEKLYFVTNSSYFVLGVVITIVVLAVSFLSQGTNTDPAALFLIVWLTFWTFGVVVLLKQVWNAWQAVRQSVLYIFPALFVTAFSIPFVGAEIFVIYQLAELASPSMVIVVLLTVVINWIFYELLKAPTLAGRQLLDKVEGFRNYIELAEKHELDYRHPKGRCPELFEAYLPYALALGVEQQWGEQFADVLAAARTTEGAYSPSWYHGSRWNSANIGSFTSSLGSSFSSAISSSSRTPGSSSGGGGGSSGGGGGGGGGGGW
jgi:uncharacterized membrane protein YgcG